MTDHVLEKARAKRERLARDLAELDAFLKVYEEIVGEPPEDDAPHIRHRTRPVFHGGGEAQRIAPSNPQTETFRTVQAAREIIADRGRPIPLSELYAGLTKRGMSFGGKNPVNTLGARLSNAGDVVVTLKGFGWWLAEQPYAPAGYTPPETKPAGEQGPPAGSLV